jgi:p-cumate 2,3-dioxygenase beta subunit
MTMQTTRAAGGDGATGVAAVSRSEVEDFLYHEATLLDEWRLEEWFTLFEPGAHYLVPSTDRPGSDPRTAQFLISDDHDRIRARVKRLNSRNAHAENPRSRTRRLITNVQVRPSGIDAVAAMANFLIYRIRDGQVDPYVGHYVHELRLTPDGLRFTERRAILDYERLQPGGRISFIL